MFVNYRQTPEVIIAQIDRYLASSDFHEVHEIKISCPPEQIYPLIRGLDFRESRITHLLFRLRGLPAGATSIAGMVKYMNFFILEDCPPDELLIGALADGAGRLLKLTDAAEFQSEPGDNGIKIIWNFSLHPFADGTIVRTETRVACRGNRMRRRFALYWTVIRPFSGLIRMEMLRLLRRKCQRAP